MRILDEQRVSSTSTIRTAIENECDFEGEGHFFRDDGASVNDSNGPCPSASYSSLMVPRQLPFHHRGSGHPRDEPAPKNHRVMNCDTERRHIPSGYHMYRTELNPSSNHERGATVLRDKGLSRSEKEAIHFCSRK